MSLKPAKENFKVIGLVNRGTTSFMNTIFQVIFSLSTMRFKMISEWNLESLEVTYGKKINGKQYLNVDVGASVNVIRELIKLFEEMSSTTKSSVKPTKLLVSCLNFDPGVEHKLMIREPRGRPFNVHKIRRDLPRGPPPAALNDIFIMQEPTNKDPSVFLSTLLNHLYLACSKEEAKDLDEMFEMNLETRFLSVTLQPHSRFDSVGQLLNVALDNQNLDSVIHSKMLILNVHLTDVTYGTSTALIEFKNQKNFPPLRTKYCVAQASVLYTIHAVIKYTPPKTEEDIDHYVVYIKHHLKKEWWLFNDAEVTLVGEIDDGILMTNVCMVFYIRNDVLGEEVY